MAGEGFAEALEAWNRERDDFLRRAMLTLKISGISGAYVEFGSWGGNSMRSAHRAIEMVGPERPMWAFDSFTGERPPERAAIDVRGWDEHRNAGPSGVEVFHETCAANGIPRDRYEAVEGYFEDTLPPRGDAGEPHDIALAYVDCNLYESTRVVMAFLEPRLKHGMIVAFDDYWCYSADYVSGERAMLHDFEREVPGWRFVRYKDFHHAGVAFVVEDAAAIERR